MGEEPAPSGDDSRLWTARLRHPTLLCGLTMERDGAVRADRRARGRDGRRRARPKRSRAPTPPGAARTARSALGFEELLDGDVEAMKRRTRNYAKRQLSWMRRLPDVHRIDLTERECRRRRRSDRPYTGRAARPGRIALTEERLSDSRRPCSLPPFVVAVLAAFVPSAYAVRDFSSTARNIIPSGQWGAIPSAGGTPTPDQAAEQAQALRRAHASVRQGHAAAPEPLLQVREARHEGPGTAHARARAAQGPPHHPRPLQRAAHLRQDERRRDLGRGLGARPRPRAAARAGALQRPCGGRRRARPDGDRPDRRPQDASSAERPDRARGAQGGRQAARPTASRGAACCTTSTCTSRASTPTTRPTTRPTSPGSAAT